MGAFAGGITPWAWFVSEAVAWLAYAAAGVEYKFHIVASLVSAHLSLSFSTLFPA